MNNGNLSIQYPHDYKLRIKNYLVSKIYNQAEIIFEAQINELIFANAKEIDEFAALQDGFTSYVNYEGTNYFSKPIKYKGTSGRLVDIKTHQCTNNTLLPEFEVKLKKLLQERSEIAEEKLKVTNYIQNVLNEISTLADIYLLFPTSVHRYLPPKDDSKATLIPYRVKYVQTLYDHYQSVLSERILTNLLFTEK